MNSRNLSFSDWLISVKNFQKKSSFDVISRLRRVQKYVEINKKEDLSSIIKRLDRSNQFNELSLSVKSQLKRAIKLHKEYLL